MTPVTRRLALANACAVSAGALCIALALFTVPPGFVGSLGLAGEGARRFEQVIPLVRNLGPLPTPYFLALLRFLFVATWAAWVVLLVRGFRGVYPAKRATVSVVVVTAALLALLAPPVLSRDVFAYVAYGRLPLRYGLNPYGHDRPALEAAGDPAADFLVWSTPLPYGPLWTLGASGLAAAGSVGDVYPEVAAHKMLAAAALIAAAFAGARLAERREPGRGPLTFLAIGMNPLFLLEGPGSGHNDFAMMALLSWGAVYSTEGRRWPGWLGVGLAIAIKPVALAAVPALVLYNAYRWPDTKWRDLGVTVASTLGPFVALSFLFGGPATVLRSTIEQSVLVQSPTARLLSLAIAATSILWAWRFVRQTARSLPAAWLTAWVPLSVAMVVVATRQWFPWYVAWALLPSLMAWDERHRVLTTGVASLGLLLNLLYTIPD
jgi:hypothetical protein